MYSYTVGVDFESRFHPLGRRGLSMNLSDFVLDNLDRIQRVLTEAVDSLTYEELTWWPGAEANPIGFILWHQVRCEDTYIFRP